MCNFTDHIMSHSKCTLKVNFRSYCNKIDNLCAQTELGMQ